MIDTTAGLPLPMDPCVSSCRPGELCPGPALTRESVASLGKAGERVPPVRGFDEAAVRQV